MKQTARCVAIFLQNPPASKIMDVLRQSAGAFVVNIAHIFAQRV
jgi:hypothetical protein